MPFSPSLTNDFVLKSFPAALSEVVPFCRSLAGGHPCPWPGDAARSPALTPPCLAAACCLQPQGRECCILASSSHAAGRIIVTLIKAIEKRPLTQARLCSMEANSSRCADTKSLRSMRALPTCCEAALLPLPFTPHPCKNSSLLGAEVTLPVGLTARAGPTRAHSERVRDGGLRSGTSPTRPL